MQKKTLEKILYVEDDPNIQELVSISLEDIGGYKLRTCYTGKEALEEIDKFKPDLLLLDVMLPDMDGPTILKEIRKNSKYDEIPVIFISAHAQREDLIKYVELGAIGVIDKPFDPITISEAINSLYTARENSEN
jgi:two-component system, OmpR family, response regulator